MPKQQYDSSGPFRASQLNSGDRYELSDGHAIYCLPSGSKHASQNLTAASVLDTDPATEWAGVDAGYAPEESTLRAPDVAVGPQPEQGAGWIRGVPPLALEIADRGQDEEQLQQKIQELLAAGTQYIWVVRLTGPQRVEEYRSGQAIKIYSVDDTLQAPGILQNSVPVRAFFDRDAAHEATLRNLLQRHGYESLEAIQAESRTEGRTEGRTEEVMQNLFTVLATRGLELSMAQRQQIQGCQDLQQLQHWFEQSLQISTAEQLFRS